MNLYKYHTEPTELFGYERIVEIKNRQFDKLVTRAKEFADSDYDLAGRMRYIVTSHDVVSNIGNEYDIFYIETAIADILGRESSGEYDILEDENLKKFIQEIIDYLQFTN